MWACVVGLLAGLCGVVRRRGRVGSRVRMVSQPRISRPYLRVNGGLLSGSPRSVAGSLLPVPLPPVQPALFPVQLVMVAVLRGMMRW